MYGFLAAKLNNKTNFENSWTLTVLKFLAGKNIKKKNNLFYKFINLFSVVLKYNESKLLATQNMKTCACRSSLVICILVLFGSCCSTCNRKVHIFCKSSLFLWERREKVKNRIVSIIMNLLRNDIESF